MLLKQVPTAVTVIDAARNDLLDHSYEEDFVYLHFPQEHWRKVWSNNPLQRLN